MLNTKLEEYDKDSHEERREKTYFLKVLEEKLAFIIVVPILSFMATLLIFHFYRVDGMSMEDTFQHEDLLIVEKVGKTTSSLTRKSYIPKRYEVIVFKEPKYDEEAELVKRVIGLPGDKIVLKEDKVIIYNQENPRGFGIDKYMPALTKIKGDTYSNKKPIEIKVDEDEVFVMGDNRPGSDDSRLFGPIDPDNITGRAIVRALPIDSFWIF